MNLSSLVLKAKEKDNFTTLEDYSRFCREYLEFIQSGLQAVIVSQNENNYRFFQYKSDGSFNVSRPINSNLMYSIHDFDTAKRTFDYSLRHIRDIKDDSVAREKLNRYIYTCQQAIGATLDALPAGESNTARKINGDLFERYIRIIIRQLGINVRDGIVRIPITVDGVPQFEMTYQHDLIIENDKEVLAIGSVKTSSKDRIDKVFIDKFLYNKLTDSATPHFAVFLNDVQRSGVEPRYGINTTFLTGHFKGYTVKLNPLDGVYYCDLRPNMRTDTILKTHIHSLDYLLAEDLWNFID